MLVWSGMTWWCCCWLAMASHAVVGSADPRYSDDLVGFCQRLPHCNGGGVAVTYILRYTPPLVSFSGIFCLRPSWVRLFAGNHSSMSPIKHDLLLKKNPLFPPFLLSLHCLGLLIELLAFLLLVSYQLALVHFVLTRV
jgi:hypothetical protein